jgi:predicted NUDIX family NTP pyrophosphohydrolase
VFLVHPGGPFWAKKDAGAWTIPKGEVASGESVEATARREFGEETGQALPAGVLLVPLAPIRQAGGKLVQAFAAELNVDASAIRSNTFTMEWPPRSGRVQAFPEVDRAAWFTLDEARAKMLKSQVPLLDELARLL